MAVGDFNGDGFADLAVTVSPDDPPDNLGSVSILLNDGDGTLRAPRSFAAGYDPRSIVVGDFNGDGIPDVAAANSGDHTVSILLGRGDGTFEEAQNYVVGFTFTPQALAAGDFNGDGKLDLAVANDEYGTVSVLLNRGNGTFAAGPRYTVGQDATAVAVGDFNGDGILDLAVTAGTFFNDPGTVAILLGKGDGSFQAAQNYAAGLYPFSLAVADFNQDGKLDIVVANFDEYGGTATLLLGKGDGTFGKAQLSSAADTYAYTLAVGDFNGDGFPDLAVTNEDRDSLTILLGKGDGTFRPAQTFEVGSDPDFVAVGDFNRDGISDLVVANGAMFGLGVPTITVLLGDGRGNFHVGVNYPSGDSPYSVAVGDFNQDGFADIAFTAEGNVAVLLNAADWGGGQAAFPARRSASGPAKEPDAEIAFPFANQPIPWPTTPSIDVQPQSVQPGLLHTESHAAVYTEGMLAPARVLRDWHAVRTMFRPQYEAAVSDAFWLREAGMEFMTPAVPAAPARR